MVFIANGLGLSRLAAVAITAFFSSAVAAQEDTRPVLTIAVQSDPVMDVLGPHQEVSNVAQRYLHNLFDGLLSIDYVDNWALRPGLAESWQRLDDRTIEFTLRRGVLFHNGEELTAEDVVFSLSPERLLDESWPGAGAMTPFWSVLDTVEAIDRYTVRFTTNAVDPLFEYRVAAMGSEIISRTAFEAAESIEAWNRAPVGTGPFRVLEYRADERAVYGAFDDYWGGPPNVREVHWIVIPEVAGRVAGLVAGDYDIITNLPPDQLDQVDQYEHLETVGGPIGNHHILIFDTQNPILADPRMRHALSLAIDRELIVEALWAGRTRIPNSYQWPAFGALYFEDRPTPAYDPEQARALVAQTDYDGSVIPFNIVNNYYTTEVARAEVLVDMWRSIGVNVEITIHEDFSALNGGLRNGSTSILSPDPVGSIVRTWGRGSYWDRQDVMAAVEGRERFFDLGQELAVTLDTAERRRIFGEILTFFEAEMPNVVLNQNAMFYGKRMDVDWQPIESPIMELRASNLQMN